MAFEKPEILFFLLFLIIPILIHLFNFKKYKKIYFPNIHLLQKIKTEKKKISKIKNLIILLTRLILLTSLIIAFSKPYIPSKGFLHTKIEKVSIYIDNSLSMSTGNETAKIEEAKQQAKKIINSLNDEVEINIITNDLDFKNERFLKKEQSLELIDNIELSPYILKVCDVIKRQTRITKNDSLINTFLISDFQENFFKDYSACSENIAKNNLISINHSSINNISLNACYFKSPFRKINQDEELIIEIENHNEEKKENLLLELFINNKKRGFLNFDIEGKSLIKKTIPYTNLESGNINGKIIIENDDFTYDNTLFFSYEVKEKINILSISENEITNSIKKVYNDKIFELDVFQKKQINFEKINNYDLIILDHLTNIQKGLSSFIKTSLINGTNVIIFPNNNIDLESYNFFMKETKADQIKNWNNEKKEIKKINYDHFIFENVFTKNDKNIELPYTLGYYKLKSNILNQRNNILNFLNNEPFLTEYNNYKGSMYFYSSPLNSNITNLTKHAIFLPLMYNASFNIFTPDLYEMINHNIRLTCPKCNIKSNIYLKKDNEFELILDNKIINNNTFLEVGKNVKEQGIYNLHFSENMQKNISFNYNREEGKNNNTMMKDQNILSNFIDKKNNKENKKRKNLIFYFIILGIISFLCETLLLKFWKN